MAAYRAYRCRETLGRRGSIFATTAPATSTGWRWALDAPFRAALTWPAGQKCRDPESCRQLQRPTEIAERSAERLVEASHVLPSCGAPSGTSRRTGIDDGGRVSSPLPSPTTRHSIPTLHSECLLLWRPFHGDSLECSGIEHAKFHSRWNQGDFALQSSDRVVVFHVPAILVLYHLCVQPEAIEEHGEQH